MGRAAASPPTALVLVAVLALLAGCGGLGSAPDPGPAGDGGPTGTVTPVAPPDLADPIVPGVYPVAVNGSVLGDAHHRALIGRSFTLRTALTTTGEEGRRYRRTGTRRVGPGGVPMAISQNFSFRTNGSAAYGLYYDGNASVVRQRSVGGGVSISRYEVAPPVDATERYRLVRTFDALALYGVERAGEGVRVTGAVRGAAGVPTPPATEDPRNATLTAEVGPDGVVERLAVGYEATYRTETVRVRYALRFVEVGSTTVGRPAWAANAAGEPETDPSEARDDAMDGDAGRRAADHGTRETEDDGDGRDGTAVGGLGTGEVPAT